MERLSLNGQWTVARAGKKDVIPATVPGCIHTDLLAAGKIEDPFFRDNEQKQFWIGESDWIYRRRFVVSRETLANDRVLLVCEGLDTLATVRLNGRVLGKTNNMHRPWTFDVKRALRPGANEIEIRFASAVGPTMLKNPEASKASATDLPGRNLVRKEQCNYGWDWGPKCLTCGIWRPIHIVAFRTARLGDVQILQDHSAKGVVKLDVRVDASIVRRAPLSVDVEVSCRGQRVKGRGEVRHGSVRVKLSVRNPRLWWPNGMGRQDLYSVKVVLRDAAGRELDRVTKRIGLRTLELVRRKDKWGESFHFAANGVPFFAKGGNWIPADQFQNRVTPQRYHSLLQSAAAANMNFVRVWGGGIYENDVFYDLCDELGLCVWQDFMFACGVYPADASFLENVRREAVANVRRLRHHASLALWCGNNEMEQGWMEWGWMGQYPARIRKGYERMFHEVIPAVVKAEDPSRPYWPSSASSGRPFKIGPNDPRMGDAHLWDVWHGREPFEWYRRAFHRFCSEFGFQAFPEPKTVRGYTAPGDRNVSSRVMELHQRSGIGNATIMHYMLSWYRMPKSFEDTLWMSQLQQGLAIQYAVEHWRRNMPRCMGAIYWQLNDTWPVASWASIDYHGRWKALHYLAKKFFAPALVSVLENRREGTMELHVANDHRAAVKGTLAWTLTHAGGKRVDGARIPVTVGANQSAKIRTLDLKRHVKMYGEGNLLFWVELQVGGRVLSRNFATFVRPKHLDLVEPGIAVRVTAGAGGRFVVTLKARKPALWAWLDLGKTDAVFSDNWVCLEPGRAVAITVTPAEKLTRGELLRQLKVRSLVDTYA